MMPLAARRLLVVEALALLSVASLAHAQTWTGLGADNKWSTTLNWDTAVPGTGNTANFVDTGNSKTNISLSGGSQPIGTLNFDTASAAAYNLGVLSSGDTFTFDPGGTITMGSAVTNAETINAAIVASGGLNINLSSATTAPGLKLEGGIALEGTLNLGPTGTTSGPGASGAITVDRPITGGGNVNSTIRTGSLNLNAQSTYSGGTTFNATNGGEQPAIRLGVDTVGSPGAVESGPLGTGSITTQSGNPVVFQPIGGDRTIANDWLFVNAIFVGATASAPLVDTTPHNLTLTGPVALGTSGRILTNNFPAGVSLNFGSSTVTSNLTLSSALTFQTQTSIAGTTGGGKAIINDPIVDGIAAGAITVQNSAIVVMKNANNSYTGATTIQGTGGTPGLPNPTLLVDGAKTGTGAVNVNTQCNNGATPAAAVACSAATAVSIRGVGLLGGTGSIAGAVANNGIISPGDVAGTPGTLTLTGNLTDGSNATPIAFSSHWAIDLNGAASDKLVVGGNIDLTKVDNLDISGTGSGTSWVIATYAGTLTGTFDAITPGYSVNYGTGTNSQITLNLAPVGVPGDYNNNGIVDAGDYVIWRKLNGQAVALQNEVSGTTPGQVTQEDYNAWRARFGNPPGSGSSLGGTAVPEPGSVMLMMFAVGAAFCFQRR
jgi:fibronectin-binding autotransporter adhesin